MRDMPNPITHCTKIRSMARQRLADASILSGRYYLIELQINERDEFLPFGDSANSLR
jgi:hypothetical protein